MGGESFLLTAYFRITGFWFVLVHLVWTKNDTRGGVYMENLIKLGVDFVFPRCYYIEVPDSGHIIVAEER